MFRFSTGFNRVILRSRRIWFQVPALWPETPWRSVEETNLWSHHLLFLIRSLFCFVFRHLHPKVQNALLMLLVNLSMPFELACLRQCWGPVLVQCPLFFYRLLLMYILRKKLMYLTCYSLQECLKLNKRDINLITKLNSNGEMLAPRNLRRPNL